MKTNIDNNVKTSTVSEKAKTAEQENLLNIAKYTEGVINYIRDADTPLLIAINGEWGSGKTSLMNDIKGELCDGEDKEFYGVWINTWQFSLSNFTQPSQAVVRILQSIVNQIIKLKPDYERRDKIAKLIGSIAALSTNLKSVSDAAGDPLFGVGKTTIGVVAKASTILKDWFSSKSGKSSDDNAALVTQLSAEIQKLVDDVLTEPQEVHDIHVQQYVLFNPLNPSDWINKNRCLGIRLLCAIIVVLCNLLVMIGFVIYNIAGTGFNLINIILTHSWFLLTDFWKHCCCHIYSTTRLAILNKEEMPDKNKRNKRKGFIFFIDDLDRIDPELALSILEALAGTFSFEKCIFVLALDRTKLIDVIRSKLEASQLNSSNINCNLYLNKFVHMSIDMPIESYDLSDLLKKCFEKISFFTNDELKNKDLIASLNKAICSTVGQNPRSVKQVINQVSLNNVLKNCIIDCNDNNFKELIERIGYDSDEITKNEWKEKYNIIVKEITVIVQCIKNIYPDLYEVLPIQPYFLNWSFRLVVRLNDEKLSADQIKDVAKKALGRSDLEDWMCVLFYLCGFDKYPEQNLYKINDEFYKIVNVFATTIFDIFRNYFNHLRKTAFENSVTDELPKKIQDMLPKLDSELFIYNMVFQDVFKFFNLTSHDECTNNNENRGV